MEEVREQQQQQHTCKLCSKTFSSGRSLGGHMRSHVHSSQAYLLRNNPKKRFRLSDFLHEDTNYPQNAAKKRRTKRASPAPVTRYNELEPEDVAIILMMLSRDNELGRRYKCLTCNRGFQSYHALGGHRASHKRIGNCCKESGRFEEQKKRIYECDVCGRVFMSGQALGGHKRSHLVSNDERVVLDLNVPSNLKGWWDDVSFSN